MSGTCEHDQHRCRNGVCIDASWYCDGFNDCKDQYYESSLSSDEINCFSANSNGIEDEEDRKAQSGSELAAVIITLAVICTLIIFVALVWWRRYERKRKRRPVAEQQNSPPREEFTLVPDRSTRPAPQRLSAPHAIMAEPEWPNPTLPPSFDSSAAGPGYRGVRDSVPVYSGYQGGNSRNVVTMCEIAPPPHSSQSSSRPQVPALDPADPPPSYEEAVRMTKTKT